jgi:hypothetical protein
MQDHTPIIFWHSDPVGPDETLVIAGGDFAPGAVAELRVLPDDGATHDGGWTTVTPLQATEISLKAVIPAAWEPSIYECRIRQGSRFSETRLVNAPDMWWKQGDEGVDRARQGGWLRILGKCLDIAGGASVTLFREGSEKKEIRLEVEDVSGYSLKAKVPADLRPGTYRVAVQNGKGGQPGSREAGTLEVLPARAAPSRVLNVVEMGADPYGLKDSTLAIVQATERISAIGGGVVFFPRGRYRIDSTLRSGTWIASPILIPEKVTFRGEGTDLVSLWWPDREKPLATLLEGRDDFGIEDLSIFTQGHHSTIITGASNARIRNVRIRANCFYMTNNNGGQHHRRKVEPPGASGAAILLWGDNNQVTDCDIFTSALAFDLRSARGSRIANNTVCANNLHFFNGSCELIFENNRFSGNGLTAGGCNIGLHMGASIARHVYYANNQSAHVYGGDREAFTLDGHAMAYAGRVKNVSGDTFVLAGTRNPADPNEKESRPDMHAMAVSVVDGKGTGQYRWLKSYDRDTVTVDREWDLPPDATSQICIGGFNGRHLFIGNTAIDTGTLIQLYPPNCECIVAGNRSIRASNINSLGKLWVLQRVGGSTPIVETSWYNQFLDNHVVTGNTWGGGGTQIDRWIGGECTLNIWGWAVVLGADEAFVGPEALKMALGEEELRAKGVPMSRFQIVRRHRIDNNSSIRVHGAVADVLIEACDIRLCRKGIRIDMEMDYRQPQDIGQLFDFDPAAGPENKPLPFLCPEAVLVRNNCFHDVAMPYSGTALAHALMA